MKKMETRETNKKKVIIILKKEIKWCLEHPMDAGSKHSYSYLRSLNLYEKGFIEGLEQAVWLIKKLEEQTTPKGKEKV